MSLLKKTALLLCLFTGSLYAQCTLTQIATSSSFAGGTSSSLTFGATVSSGSNRLLVVRAVTQNGDPTTVTYNSVNLTKHATQHNGNQYVSIWYLIAPATGTFNVIVNGTVGFAPIAAATTFTGANQSAPLGTAALANFTSINPFVNVSSAVGQIVIDVVNSTGPLSVGPGQVNSYSASSMSWYGSGSSESGASNVTMSWIGSNPTGAMLAVPVKSCLSLGVNAGIDKSICSGSGTAIGGSPTASGGSAPYSYSWSPTTGLSSATIANPTATPTSTTTYTVTVTDNTGATATDAVVVTVKAKPTVSAGSNTNICIGNNAVIGGSPTSTGGTSPYTYAWTPSTGLSSTTMPNPIATPTVTVTYTVTVTDNSGCTNTASITVTVNSKPTVNAGTDKTICLDSVVTIGGSPTATGGSSPYTYAWTPTTGLSSSTVANPSATPSATTTYTVTVTDNKGCFNTDAMLITVNQNAVSLTANPGINLCLVPGQPIVFTASPSNYEKYDFYRNGVLQQSGTSKTYSLTGAVTSDKIYAKVLNSSPDTVITACTGNLVQNTTISGACTTSATSFTLSYTVPSGSNRLLVVRVKTTGSDPTSITYNGASMIKFASANNSTQRVSIWYQINPATGAHNVVVNGTSGFTPIVGVTSYLGAHQTTPFGTSASLPFNSSSPSVTVTSATGQKVIDVLATTSSFSVGAGQTSQFNLNQSTSFGAGSSEDGASSTTMSWSGTSSAGVLLAVPVIPVYCAPDTTITNPACSKGKSATLTLTINPKPVITITPTTSTICKDGSANLSANGATVYSWAPATGLNTASASNVIASPTTTTTYTITGTGLEGCTNTATTQVIVNPSCTDVCDETTASWSANGVSNSRKATSDGLQAAVYLTKTGFAKYILTTASPTFANSNFWSKNTLANDASLQIDLIWDSVPNSTYTNIDLPGDDKGNGTLKIVFDKEVLDPILHIDRIGGQGPDINGIPKSNSALLTLTTPGIQLVRLSGTDDFEVTSYTIRRTPNLTTDNNVEAVQDVNHGTAAGSVKLLGLVKEALFTWTGTGVEGNGSDQIEIILEYCNDSIPPCDKIVADGGPDKTICPGSTVQIGVAPQPGYSYSWLPVTGLSCNTCANPQASPLVTTNYTLSVTYSTCEIKTDEILVTVNTIAVADAGPDKSICSGSSAQIGSTPITGYTYAWTPTAGLSCSTCANPIGNPSTTTNYTLSVNSPTCTAGGTDEVLISVSNAPIANAGVDKYICPGSSVQIGTTAQSGYTYSWAPSTGLSCTNCANPTSMPSVATTYTLVVTDVHCATTVTDVVVVMVSNQPFANAGTDKAVCPGASTQLGNAPQPGYIYSWTPTTNLSCSNCANPVVTPTVTTNYNLVVTSANCTGAGTDEILVSMTDVASVDAGADQTICPGSSIQIGNAAQADFTYSWTPSTTLSCSTCANPLATPTSSTTYTLVTTSAFCPISGNNQISVTISNTPLANAGPDKSICPGSSIELGGPSQPGYTYSWAPATGLSCATCANPQVNPAVSTNYTLTVSAINCSGVSTDDVVVTVSNSPTANAGPDRYMCPGSNAQIGIAPQPGYTYSWAPFTGLSCNTCADPLANPSTTTNYTLTVASVSCSSISTDVAVVNISTGPTAIAGPDKIICAGASVKIGAPSQSGYTYSWLPTTGLSCNTCADPIVSPTSTTNYTLTVTAVNCSGTSSDQVVVSVPDFNPTVSGTQQICYGNDIRLNASGGIYYSWMPSTGLNCTSCPNPMAASTVTTNYTVTITDVNGCIKQKTITVVVSPALNISGGPDKTGCIGDVVTLNASGGDTYIWSPADGLSCTTCPSPTLTISKNVIYTVRGFDGNCSSEDQVSVNLPAENAIDFSYTHTGCNVTLTASIAGLTQYEWNFGDGSIATTSTITHQFTKSGKYYVCLKVKSGCPQTFEICKYIEIKPEDCNCEAP